MIGCKLVSNQWLPASDHVDVTMLQLPRCSNIAWVVKQLLGEIRSQAAVSNGWSLVKQLLGGQVAIWVVKQLFCLSADLVVMPLVVRSSTSLSDQPSAWLVKCLLGWSVTCRLDSSTISAPSTSAPFNPSII